MTLLPLFLVCYQYAILSVASLVTFPPITLKEQLQPSTDDSTNGPVVPVECQQTCASIVPLTLGNQSCTPNLCCNSQWEQTYYSCIVCAAQVQQISDLSNAQHTLDEIYADCALVGSPVPLLTFPGQSPNRSLPSASILPSQSTASGNSTASTSASGSSTSSSLTSSSTASSTASPSSTSTSNSCSSTRNQWSITLAIFITSITFDFL